MSEPQDNPQTKKTGVMARLRRTAVALWPRRRPNVFGVLIAVATAAVAVRLVNVAAFALHVHDVNAPEPGITREATAQEVKKAPAQLSEEDAPPLTQDDVNRAVRATAQQLDGKDAPVTTAPATTVMADAPKQDTPKIDTSAVANDPAAAPAADAAAPAVPTADADGREFSPSEIDVLQSLAKRREELDQRERNLNESAAMLKAAEKEVDRKLEELTTLKADIEKLLGQQEKAEDGRIESLVKIYEAMKPKEAATIFNTLDLDVLLSVVSRMNERKLSPVLAAMDPDRARLVTIRLAEQRQLPGADKAAAGAAMQSPAGGAPSPVLNLPSQPLPPDGNP